MVTENWIVIMIYFKIVFYITTQMTVLKMYVFIGNRIIFTILFYRGIIFVRFRFWSDFYIFFSFWYLFTIIFELFVFVVDFFLFK